MDIQVFLNLFKKIDEFLKNLKITGLYGEHKKLSIYQLFNNLREELCKKFQELEISYHSVEEELHVVKHIDIVLKNNDRLLTIDIVEEKPLTIYVYIEEENYEEGLEKTYNILRELDEVKAGDLVVLTYGLRKEEQIIKVKKVSLD